MILKTLEHNQRQKYINIFFNYKFIIIKNIW